MRHVSRMPKPLAPTLPARDKLLWARPSDRHLPISRGHLNAGTTSEWADQPQQPVRDEVHSPNAGFRNSTRKTLEENLSRNAQLPQIQNCRGRR